MMDTTGMSSTPDTSARFILSSVFPGKTITVHPQLGYEAQDSFCLQSFLECLSAGGRGY
jgi:hypothetical protein